LRKEGRKAFFFEKKKQKTFVSLRAVAREARIDTGHKKNRRVAIAYIASGWRITYIFLGM
jgi:hypothetical protein